MKKPFVALSICFISTYFLSSPILAQPIKFGRVTAEELKSTSYEKDSSASAAVLYDFGKTDFRYLDNYGFRVETTRTVRIKIYNNSGYDWGNVHIPLYKDGYNRTEIVQDIKGYVYNLENGMIQRDELNKKDIYEEDVSEKWRNVKFAFPNVKAGTVLEYTYTVISPFIFKLDDWKFQYDIPVKWSEYMLTVPAFYQYMILKQGYFDFVIQEAELLDFEHQLGSYTYNNIKYHWAMENIPAYRDEEFMTTREDYIAKVVFQLSKVNYPGRHVKDYMTTWSKLVEDLMSLTDFGKNIDKNDTEDIVNTLTEGLDSEESKARAVYQYVHQNFAWNQKKSYAPSHSLKQLLKAKEGNGTDINLLLLNMLKKAGIQANAVLLSTREHGNITTKFPLIDQFNFTIVLASIEGQNILLDATDTDLPFGMISESCLNGYGLLVDESSEEEKWLDVTQQGMYYWDIFLYLNYDAEKQAFIAQVKENYKDYGALRARKMYNTDKEKLYRFQHVNELKFHNTDEKDKPLSLAYLTEYPVESLGDIVYIDPFLPVEKDNPFKSQERYFPVDYSIRRTIRCSFNLVIPQGYTLDEKPDDIQLSLKDKSVSFITQSQLSSDNLQIVSQLQVNKTRVPVEQYQDLRALYTEMISKQMEKIVLKKIKTE